MTDPERVVELAAVWTALTAGVVAALAAVAQTGPIATVGGTHAALHASGPAVGATNLLAWGFLLVVPVVVLGAPLAVGWYRVATGAYDLATGVAGTVAAFAVFPGVPVAWTTHGPVAGLALGTVAVVAFLVGVDRLDRDESRSDRPSLAPQFAHVGLFVLLVAGIVAGSAVGVGGQSLAVVDRHVPPDAAFEASYEATDDGRGLVTIRHAGGDAVDASDLSLYGEGFADVSGADQTGPGNWQGPTSGVGPGDSVTVGVERDCRIRVVHTGNAGSTTLAVVECSELR
jgi:hypothetical protein